MNPTRRGPMWWPRMAVVTMTLALSARAVEGRRSSAAGAAQAAVPVLSLRMAVAQALDRNPTILNARATADQASQTLRLANSAFTPKVLPSLSGALGQTDLSNQTYGVNVSQRFHSGVEFRGNLTASSFRNQLGTYYYSDSTFQLNQPLLRGFGSSVTTRPLLDAEGKITDAQRQLALAEQQLALEVASAYYAVVVQARAAGLAQAGLERAQNLRDASAARVAIGRVSQLDLLRAEQLVGQSQVDLLDAEGALSDAQDRLRVLLGQPAGEEFAIEDDISLDVEPIELAQAPQLAWDNRLELKTALNAVSESDRAVAAARSLLRPQLDLGVAVTRRETAPDLGSAFGVDRFRPAVFTAISMPVDRTVDDVALQNALIDRGRRQLELDSLRERVAQEARQAVRRQERAVRTLALARASVGLAEKEVEVATFRFQRGLSDNLDLVSAQTTLRAAENREVAVRAEVALARLAVRAAVGRLDPRVDVN